jgi:superfamily II DNA or RNA helicase
MKLHEHQIEAVKAIEDQFAMGARRTLAVLATGTGKTIIYLYLADKWAQEGKRILILAHRRELIHQPQDRAQEFFPKLASKMGIVMANMDDANAQVVIATIQTVSRDSERLQKIGKFDYVILDECHHGTANTYLKLVAHFPGAKWLGLTATPFRTDGDSLVKVFDSVAYRFPIVAAIDGQCLVPFDAFGFTLPMSVEGVEETIDGWAEDALGDLLSAENVLEVVYEKWAEYCKDRMTICFTASVVQAHATAEYFRSQGVSAAAVDGSTPKALRDDLLTAFRKGEIQVIANCQVWTEGVDVPEASAALMVCPTKSDLAYVQKLGRILRTYKGKKNAIVLDFAPIEDRNIVMAGDILGIPRIVKKAEEKAKKGGVLIGVSSVDEYGIAVSVDPADVIVEALKYLRRGFLAWALQDYMAVASLSDSAMLAIELPNVSRIAKAEQMRKEKNWNASFEKLYKYLLGHKLWVVRKYDSYAWVAEFQGQFSSMEEAIDFGEKIGLGVYQPSLAKKRKAWRRRPASEPQIGYMKRLDTAVPENCDQGQAAQLISFALATRSINKDRARLERIVMEGA